jgi:hypothetical protein
MPHSTLTKRFEIRSIIMNRSFSLLCLVYRHYISWESKRGLGMPSSGMLRRVALVRTDVSEECSAFIIRVTVGELGTT